MAANNQLQVDPQQVGAFAQQVHDLALLVQGMPGKYPGVTTLPEFGQNAGGGENAFPGLSNLINAYKTAYADLVGPQGSNLTDLVGNLSWLATQAGAASGSYTAAGTTDLTNATSYAQGVTSL